MGFSHRNLYVCFPYLFSSLPFCHYLVSLPPISPCVGMYIELKSYKLSFNQNLRCRIMYLIELLILLIQPVLGFRVLDLYHGIINFDHIC